MFGVIKENILSKLEKTYANGDVSSFKKEFNRYIKTIKENKDLKEFYEVYDLFKQVNFDDIDVAKEFVEESISYLKQFNKSEVDKLTELTETKHNLNKKTIEFKLDQLIFNENISLKEKAQYKVELIKQITQKENAKIDYKDSFEVLHKKINENISKLSNDQTQALELFIENDTNKINDFYQNLINNTETIVEGKILNTENSDVIKKLVEVKKRLNSLKAENPTIFEIEKIINLKESLN